MGWMSAQSAGQMAQGAAGLAELLQAGLRDCAAGRSATAIPMLRRACAAAPALGFAQRCLGLALQLDGRPAEAIACYERAAALDPRDAEALAALGALRLQCGDPAAALAPLGAALRLRPADQRSMHRLGLALHRVGRSDAGIALLQRAAFDPPDAAALADLGAVLLDRREAEAAVLALRRALAVDPSHLPAWRNLGNAALACNDLAGAEDAYRRALALGPADAANHANLAAALNAAGRFDEALESCAGALALQPDCVPALVNRGVALSESARYAEAIDSFAAALVHAPEHAEALTNLAVVLDHAGRSSEALAAHRRAVAVDASPRARCNHALALLAAGDYAEGWREFEWRWGMPTCPHHGVNAPLWHGEALGGRTILLHAEGGFGDTLQFARYVPLVAARGGRVLLRVQPPLVRLMQRLPGVAEILSTDMPLPPFDLQCPLLSLPLAFGTTLETIPPAQDFGVAAGRPGAATADGGGQGASRALAVGLVWAGAPRPEMREAHLADRRRSMALAELAPLLGVAGVRFHSLQKGPAAAEAAAFPAIEAGAIAGATDFLDTARLVAELDLVISVDTAVAHLAASMGRPVWLLSRYDACWRWMRNREDTPWYPQMWLLRQPTPGDWGSVVGRAAAALARHSIC